MLIELDILSRIPNSCDNIFFLSNRDQNETSL